MWASKNQRNFIFFAFHKVCRISVVHFAVAAAATAAGAAATAVVAAAAETCWLGRHRRRHKI